MSKMAREIVVRHCAASYVILAMLTVLIAYTSHCRGSLVEGV